MNELQLVKSEPFGDIQCDIYSNGGDLCMTRDQIGRALKYAYPKESIAKIHERNEKRLNNPHFSGEVNLTTPTGGTQATTIYTRKGIMEICRHSSQPNADSFIDWVWDVMDGLITGQPGVMGFQIQLKGVQVQEAQILERIGNQYDGTYRQILHAYATKALTGEYLLPLPKLEAKTYTAQEIGEQLGISKNKVGILANANGLKTEEYGAWFNDKAKGHNKEVQTFRYYDKVIPVLKSLLNEQ